jgi:hypothetical protein
MPILHDETGRIELSNMLFQCFDALKVYGKEPEQMKGVNAMFQLALAEYPIGKIREAFAFYLKHNNELPAAGDIAHIIMRGNKPPFERSVYIRLAQKRKDFPESMTHEEWAYMDEYERFIVTGKY